MVTTPGDASLRRASRVPLPGDGAAAQAGDNGQMDTGPQPAAPGWPGRVLAFARAAEPRTPVSRRARAGDAALAVLFAAASLAAAKTGTSAAVCAIGTTVQLAARRTRPLTAFWIILIITVATASNTTTVTFFAVMLAAYSAVVYSRFHGLAVLSVSAAAIVITAAFPDTSQSIPARYTALTVFIPIIVVGAAMHAWRRRAGHSQTRLHRMAAEHEAATRRALELERTRIARDLHDVVTHNVSSTVVLAGAARRVFGTSPEQATAALLAVEASGRAAMTELRHLLGLLDPHGGPADAIPAGPGSGPASPQPGLGRLQSLIDGVAAGGLVIDLHVSGSPRELPPGLDLAAYRVIQEGLTNVMKHAGAAKTTIMLDYGDAVLQVEVADDGQPGPGTSPDGSAVIPGTGRGLLGLRERVTMYGGDFDVGRRPDGGWRIRAQIPLDPQTDGPPAIGSHGPAHQEPVTAEQR